MNKKEVKNILISMRTLDNEAVVNYLLGEIDMRDEAVIEQITANMGNSEENVRDFLAKKIERRHSEQNNEKYPINDLFTYGISGNCIHLHLPIDLHESIAKNGRNKTMDLVNLQLLDAIDKIKALKDSDLYRFKDKDSLYMISPALIKKEMIFLEELDFTTHLYSKKKLSDEKFVQETPEAQLAVHIFGKDKNVGTASIGFDVIDSKEWQEKRKNIIQRFRKHGISLEDSMEKIK